MLSKNLMKTIAFTLLTIALINKVEALAPIRKAVFDDGGFF